MATARSSRVRFRERAELLDFLLEVSTLAAETLDLDQLMENVARIVRQVIPFELFAILLHSEKAHGLRIRHALGHRDEVVRNFIIPLGEGITGVAAATRQPVMVGDVREDPRYLNALDAVRSELAVPMVSRQKLVGVLDLQSTTKDAFSAQDRALLQLIASRVGAAIENARLYRRVERQNKTQRLLAHMGHEFSSILRLEKLLDKVAKSIRTLISYDAFIIMEVDEKERLLRSLFSLRYDQKVQHGSLPLDKGLTGAAARSRKPVLARDTLADPRFVETHPGIRSEIALPLIVKDRVIGVLDVESERLNYFTEEHVRTLQLIAPQIAISLENARLYEQVESRERAIQEDLTAARKVQALILPSDPPEIAGLDVGVRWKPARTISGDLFDFFDYDDDNSVLAFGDSSGKGAAAALYGALFSGLLRSQAPRKRSPAGLLQSLNETLMERQIQARYVTLLVMQWQPRDKSFVIANAGSTLPMVCRAGEIVVPEVAGVPVGLLQNVEYEELRFAAKSGDVVVLYSDGVQDQTNPLGEDYGKSRLPKFLLGVADRPAQEIARLILTDVDQFRQSQPVHDDQTIIVLKVQ